MQSLAAITGPMVAGGLYDHLGHSSPYIAGAALFALTIGALQAALPRLGQIRESTSGGG